MTETAAETIAARDRGAEPAVEPQPYIMRTYDRWIVLVLVVVLGWVIFRPLFAFSVYYRGLSFERMFQMTTALHYYRKSTQVDAHVPFGWQGWAELVMMRAPSDPVARADAISILRRGIANNPTYGPLEFDLGRTYFMGKNYLQAREAFVRAARLMPNDLFTWDYAAWSSFHAGDVRTALSYWHQVLRIDPGNKVARQQIAHYGDGRS